MQNCEKRNVSLKLKPHLAANSQSSPEPVKAVDVDPHPQVGEEEPEHLPVGVVEEARVPELVVAAAARVEEAGNQFNREILSSALAKQEGNALRNLRPAMFQQIHNILHSLVHDVQMSMMAKCP